MQTASDDVYNGTSSSSNEYLLHQLANETTNLLDQLGRLSVRIDSHLSELETNLTRKFDSINSSLADQKSQLNKLNSQILERSHNLTLLNESLVRMSEKSGSQLTKLQGNITNVLESIKFSLSDHQSQLKQMTNETSKSQEMFLHKFAQIEDQITALFGTVNSSFAIHEKQHQQLANETSRRHDSSVQQLTKLRDNITVLFEKMSSDFIAKSIDEDESARQQQLSIEQINSTLNQVAQRLDQMHEQMNLSEQRAANESTKFISLDRSIFDSNRAVLIFLSLLFFALLILLIAVTVVLVKCFRRSLCCSTKKKESKNSNSNTRAKKQASNFGVLKLHSANSVPNVQSMYSSPDDDEDSENDQIDHINLDTKQQPVVDFKSFAEACNN